MCARVCVCVHAWVCVLKGVHGCVCVCVCVCVCTSPHHLGTVLHRHHCIILSDELHAFSTVGWDCVVMGVAIIGTVSDTLQ